ncbi:MAG: hypothetical protein ACRDRN_26210 [Sciscionella sp.]
MIISSISCCALVGGGTRLEAPGIPGSLLDPGTLLRAATELLR